MRGLSLVMSALVVAVSASASYQYYYTDTLNSINTSKWTQNGSGLSANSWGLEGNGSIGGSLISSVTVPTGNSYEVYAKIALPNQQQPQGDYDLYLRATSNAMYAG